MFQLLLCFGCCVLFTVDFLLATELLALERPERLGDDVGGETRRVALNVCGADHRRWCRRVMDGKFRGKSAAATIVSEFWRRFDQRMMGNLLYGVKVFSAEARVGVELREFLKLVRVEVGMLKMDGNVRLLI